MDKTYQTAASDARTSGELSLPESVTVALTDLIGEAREGLLALAVGTGLQVMQLMLEENATALAGPRGRHDPQRTAVRHGRGAGLGHPRRSAGTDHPAAGPGRRQRRAEPGPTA